MAPQNNNRRGSALPAPLRFAIFVALVGFFAWRSFNRERPFPRTPYAAPAQMPPLGEGVKFAEGAILYKVTLERKPQPSHLWVYLPERPTTKLLPCVLIAPAGSRLFHGMGLGRGDQAEHIPYVKAGFAVVAYELDGELAPGSRGREIIHAALSFQSARAGVENAKTALDYALTHVPNIDRTRIYTAGHSSAATVSLVVAEHEPRIAACIAYAPGADAEAWIGTKLVDVLDRADPDYRSFIHEYSPINATERLQCPVFIFHADDDSRVPTADVVRFVEKLKKTNSNVTFSEVPTGDHYQSMIDQGIPQAIRWLRSAPAARG